MQLPTAASLEARCGRDTCIPTVNHRRRLLTELAVLFIAYSVIAMLSLGFSQYALLTNVQHIIPVMMAVGLGLMWGTGGILSFGQSLFYGLGGYAYGVVAINTGIEATTNLAVLVGIAVPTLTALVIGWFVFYARLSAVYVAIIMFVLTIAINSFMAQTAGPQWRIGDAFLGGTNGLGSSGGTVTYPPSIDIGIGAFHFNFASDGHGFFLLVLTLAMSSVSLARAISLSRWGLALRAVKENVSRTEAMGYDPRVLKMWIFVFGGFLAGLSGVLFVSWSNFITPDVFDVWAAILPVLWVTVGGVESIIASAMAAAGLSWLTLYLGTQGNFSNVIMGGLLVFVAVAAPRGLGPTIVSGWNRWGVADRLRQLAEGIGLGSKQASPPADRPLRPAENMAGAVGTLERMPSGCSPDVVSRPRQPVLQITGVTKSWRGVKALTDVTFAVVPGDVVCIIGPNGAGKSTLLKCITGDAIPEEGDLVLGNESIRGVPKYLRARLGISIKYQSEGIYAALTVLENLALAARSPARRGATYISNLAGDHGTHGKASLLPREIREILEQQGTMALGNLAHGGQQLVEIGMALECAPRVLILDEPVAGLSIGESARVAQLICRVSQEHNIAVIVTEHDMAFVQQLGAHVIVLHNGRVLATGTYRDMMAHEDVRKVYLGQDGP